MSEYGYTKKDWALFREKVADWQEAYMDKLNKEYIELLTGDGRPSEKFWALEERIRNDKKDYLAGVAAPASLLTHRVRGCNEIYHLK